MSLDYTVETLENVSEEHKGLYLEKDGKFILDVTGVKPLEEFNTVYTALGKERDLHKEVKTKLKGYGDHTPESIQELNNRLAELELNGGSNEAIEERLEKALKIKTAPLYQERDDLKLKNKELSNIVETMKKEKTESHLKDSITSLVTAKDSPYKTAALTDIINRAKVQELEYNEDVKTFVSKDGLTASDWLREQSKNSTWLKESVGGGAKGGRGKGLTSDPFKSGNLSEQAKLYRENPAEYERLYK